MSSGLFWTGEWGGRSLAAFGCGFFAVFLSAFFTAIALAGSDEGFVASAKVLAGAHLPIMIIEGFVTMFAYGFLAKVKPELLIQDPRSES